MSERRPEDHPAFYDPGRDVELSMVFAQWAIAVELKQIADTLEDEDE